MRVSDHARRFGHLRPKKTPNLEIYIFGYSDLVFFNRCHSLPNFSGSHAHPCKSSKCCTCLTKQTETLHTVQPCKKQLSKNTSDRGTRTCRVHDLALFRPSLKNLILASRHDAARSIHPWNPNHLEGVLSEMLARQSW